MRALIYGGIAGTVSAALALHMALRMLVVDPFQFLLPPASRTLSDMLTLLVGGMVIVGVSRRIFEPKNTASTALVLALVAVGIWTLSRDEVMWVGLYAWCVSVAGGVVLLLDRTELETMQWKSVVGGAGAALVACLVFERRTVTGRAGLIFCGLLLPSMVALALWRRYRARSGAVSLLLGVPLVSLVLLSIRS
jgi:hypothetical protein